MEEADETLEFIVERAWDLGPKTEFIGKINRRKAFKTPEVGFCRAKGAVIEALIAVTRKGVLPDDEIEAQLRQSRVIVEKTGGEAEREAMRMIDGHWSGDG